MSITTADNQVALPTVDEARARAERIRATAEALWALLAEAHDRGDWRALGYDSFKSYVGTEFGMSKQRAYQLLDQARVIHALSEAAGSTTVDLSEREARELKPHLDEVAQAVREATEDTELDCKPEAARAAIDQMRSHIREQKAAPQDELTVADADADDGLDPSNPYSWPCKHEMRCTEDEHHWRCPLASFETDEDEPSDDEDEPAALTPEVVEPDRPAITKPDLGDGISHPARYSKQLIPLFSRLLGSYANGKRVLDPFAGVGGIHALRDDGYDTTGVELEPEWANLHEHTSVGDATDLPFGDEEFDAVVTSPAYGNRLADSYNSSDPHLRRSYRFDLGRELTDGNAGAMQWGDTYRDLHLAAWAEAKRVLRPGGVLLLNIKDHYRNYERQPVAGWHVTALCRLGFTLLEHTTDVARPDEVDATVGAPNLRQGANSELRLAEQVYVMRKDTP